MREGRLLLRLAIFITVRVTLIIALIIIVIVVVVPPVCVDGWVERAGFGACYFVSTDAVVWLDARNTCHNHGASLVSVHSEHENRFVRSLV